MTSLFKKRFSLASIENEMMEKTIPNSVNKSNLQSEAIAKFREILQGEKGIDIPMDDAYLLRFLRHRKFDVEAAVKLVRRTEQWKTKNEEIFNIPFHDVTSAYENEVLNVLRQKDAHGRFVLYINAKNWDPEQLSLTHATKACWHILEEAIKSEEVQNNGIVGIFDLTGLPFTKIAYYVSFFTFKQVNRMITFFQGGSPIKLKGVYFIGSPFIVSTTFHAFKYLLKKKLRNRIIVDSRGPEALHDGMGKENLPAYLEGDLPSENSLDKDIIKAIYSNQKF